MKKHIKMKNAQHYVENKEDRDVQAKIYRESHKDEIYEQRKGYREKNKYRIKQKMKDYLPIRKQRIKDRRKTDLDFQLSEVLRSKIHKMIRGQETSYMDLIGLSHDHFRNWIEFQFTPEMSWENMGTYWHIDHVLPLSRFDFSQEKDKLVGFGWTNLQPLEAKENQSKSNKILLHYFFNNIVSIHRFIQNEHLDKSGYQRINESLAWVREILIYGKNPVYDGGASSSS